MKAATLFAREDAAPACKYYLGIMSDAEAKAAHAKYLSYEPKSEGTNGNTPGRENTAA